MNREEADRFIARLRAGESFSTRFQEQSWGLDALASGDFRKWSTDAYADPPDHSDEVLTEDALRDLMMRTYSYDIMVARLRPAPRA